MTNYTKPSNNEVNKVWATTAPTTSVQAPEDSYINLGWTQVKPPSEYFNWWMKKVDTLLAYSNQKGIPEWDANTEYYPDSTFIQHNAKIWIAVNRNINSEPSEGNNNWRNYLRGMASQSYADTVVDNLKNSLHKVATTGLASDLQGYLPWSQLSNVPQWIRESHVDNDQLYLRSPEGTQLRIANGRLDVFDSSSTLCFSVGPDGAIERGSINWNSVTNKPEVLSNIYTGSSDTVLTSKSGNGKFTVDDEWINFYPKGKGSCFSVGPDGRIYNAGINHDQVLGLGSAALTPSTDYEKSGAVNGLRNSLSEIAFTGAWASLLNPPAWVPRIYAGSSNSATGILSQSGKSRIEITDGALNFYPESGAASKFGVDANGLLSGCMMNLSSIINSDSLATKSGAGQLVITKENNGYIRFENGTILQFATGDFGTNETAMWVNFPMPFPNACLWVGVSTRLLNDNNDTNTWFQLISWDSYTAKVYRQIVDSGTNKQQTAPYIFAIGR